MLITNFMHYILQSLTKINYWDEQPDFDLGYIRSDYLEQLKKALGNKLIKVIVGQRRAGKSYIVRQFIDWLIKKKKIDPKNIFYLNKESFEYDEIRTASDLLELINLYRNAYKPSGKVYLFIDEIQNITRWERLIVSLAQNPANAYEVIITGSNSRLLSGELASLLSGRYIVTEILPFSYNEYLAFFNSKNNKENFIKYLSTSGMPEVFNLHTEDIQRHYFQSLKDTVLLKDIMYRHNIRDYVLLGDLFLFLVHNVGNMTSIPSIIKYFKSKNRKADYSTISNYISYLEEAFIIHQAPRYALKNKELLSGERKYYLNDLGFRNYLFPQLLDDIGAMLENILYIHLRKAGYTIKIGYENSFEIDFFATKSKFSLYIQVVYLLASDKTLKREFGALEKINDHFPKYVLSMDDITRNSPTGIIHNNIWDFIYELNGGDKRPEKK